ncbi:hypothetical protein B0J17DRAFT_640431 [Rhizoctonia solani]|nr:hypothetical protein B0J17DRAFT_640431 [Rhizoctonia solani]
MNEQELKNFGLAIQGLRNLEHITWDILFPSYTGWDCTIGLLRRKSPALRSLRLIIPQDAYTIKLAETTRPKRLLSRAEEVEADESGDSEEIAIFPNLHKLSIKFHDSTYCRLDQDTPSEIISLIRGARSIESLHLDFEKAEAGLNPFYWGISGLFSSLSSDYFPNLCSIRIVSGKLQNIDHFGGPEFRRFIANHNQLKQVVMSLIYPHSNPPETTTAWNVERLMPSVCYFGGTASSVGIFLQSSLAGQLEGLELSVDFKTILKTRVPELPYLKELLIRSYYFQNQGNRAWTTILRVLDQLAPKALGLRKLTIRVDNLWRRKYDSHNLPKLSHGLSQLPDLHQLTIVHREERPLNQDICERIVREFPRLELVITRGVGSRE